MLKKLLVLIIFSFNLFAQEFSDVETFLPSVQVMDITTDGINLWFATNGNGIYQYFTASGKWLHYSTKDENLQHDFFYSIAASDKFVWAGSTDGLFILEKRTGNWTKRKFGLGGQLANWIRALVYDPIQKVLWIGRFKYLTKYDLETKRFTDYDLTVKNNEKTNNIKSISVDENYLWFGTEAGLHRYDKSKDLNDQDSRRFFDTRNNSFDGQGEQVSISCILVERNYLWIGLDEFVTPERPEFNIGGLFKYDKQYEWINFDVSKGLPGNGVYDLERTGNYIWVSCYQFGKSTKEIFGRGLAIVNRATNQITPVIDERIPRNVFSIYFDGVNLWLGTDNGLIKVNFFNKLAQWNSEVKK